jgi:hypothetical protein
MAGDYMPRGRRKHGGSGARKYNTYGKCPNDKFHFGNPFSIKFRQESNFLRC